jgi:carboxypeptidase Taq
MEKSISALRALEKKLYACTYALAVMDYDGCTAAPAQSTEGRAAAAEEIARAQFELLTGPETEQLLLRAAEDAGNAQEKAEVRELNRQREDLCRIPAQEYASFARLCQEAVPVWEQAKHANDFASFAPYLEKIVAARRAQAGYMAPGRNPYEVWLDHYERGLTLAKCDAFFGPVRAAVVPLLTKIEKRGKPVRTDFLDADWPIPQQRELSRKVMELWTIDPAHCTLRETEHPFTSGFWHGDVRITTHYMPRDMVSNLYSVAHEGGHALYELHVDPSLDYTVLAGGSTTGLHESQSRLFENYIGRSRAFVACLWPELCRLFPAQLAGVTQEEFYRAVNRAQPSLVRTEADELTYSLHIMVRYELEKAMLEGSLAVRDLPAVWNRKYQEYLGVQVPDDTRGVLQDIHWATGDIGYFPSYALGSAYGAQAMASLRKKLDVDALVEQGNLAPIVQELTARLWRYGNGKEPAELVRSLCGGAFDPHWFTEYLTKKYRELYEL